MTTWDERARAEAWRKGRDEYWAGDPSVFRAGAAWQRDQLLTDDVIERAAMAILLRNYPGCTHDEARRFAGAGERDDARNDARVALTAAIGGPE